MGLILFTFVCLVLIFVLIGRDSAAERLDTIQSLGLDPDKLIHVGKYIHGHPDISVQLDDVVLAPKDHDLAIYSVDLQLVGSIPLDKIEDVTLEDASTVERRVTLARMALVGPFAFALKKKEKHELSYLVIMWKSGRFKHETYFEFQGPNAVGRASSARNQLIKTLQ